MRISMAVPAAVVSCLLVAGCLPLALAVVSTPSRLDGNGNLRQERKATNTLEANQSLIVCNAYAYKDPLDVFRVRSMKLANRQGPIAYKNCQNVVVALKEGDRLDFKAGGLDVGSFFVKGLPKSKSTLLLVPRRRNNNTMAVSFQSHAFSDLLAATQVAVVDAYAGAAADGIKIMDAPQAKQLVGRHKKDTAALVQKRVETLRYNSIVALAAGHYRLGLGPESMVSLGENSEPKKGLSALQALVVGAKEKYVVMRVGVEDNREGSALYPEELVVFPKSSSAESRRPGVVAVVLIAAAVARALCSF